MGFLRLACTCEETSLSVWLPNESLPKFNLPLLASPFGQGFRTVFVNSVNKEYSSNSVYLHALNERKIHSVQIKIILGDLEWYLNTIFSPRHPIFF